MESSARHKMSFLGMMWIKLVDDNYIEVNIYEDSSGILWFHDYDIWTCEESFEKVPEEHIDRVRKTFQ